jgi:putative ABC transport system permease protein
MLRNYIKIAFRNIVRQKGYSLLNIAGLAIGMAACIMIMHWVMDEVSYDQFHENADRIYRIHHELTMGPSTRHGATSSIPMGPAITNRFPEAIAATRLAMGGETWVKYGELQFKEENVMYADSSFFDVFTFPLIAGQPGTALRAARSVVLTEETARKYFGEEDPVGKIVTVDGEADYTITGVTKNVPGNSHIKFDVLLSLETLIAPNRQMMELWGRMGNYTYLLVEENTDPVALEAKIADLIEENLGEALRSNGASITLLLQKMTNIHLHSHLEAEFSANGNIAYVYLFSGIALLVLLMACFNFINLATARSSRRALEVSVRKTFGAARAKLVLQFLAESALYSILSVILAAILLELALPFFNELTSKRLEINYFANIWFIPGLFGFAIFIGLLAGSFPAFHLSAFEPVRVLKSSLGIGSTRSSLRRILVVIQFSITIALVIGTLAIYQQINYVRNESLGFDRENVVVLSNIGILPDQTRSTMRDELANLPGVLNVSGNSSIPGGGSLGMMNFLPEGFSDEESQLMLFISADEHYVDALGMKIVAGRNFSSEMGADSAQSVLVNETAARQFGWDDAVGKTIRQRIMTHEGPGWAERTVVGVVADFHLTSLHQKIDPILITNSFGPPMGSYNLLAIKMAPGNTAHTLDLIKDKWEAVSNGQPIDYRFLNEALDEQYRAEERLGDLTITFSLLAIFIGCLGLFGMASHAAEQRTKEIGIRKTLGASIEGIVRMLCREFLIMVAIANIIAWPIAGYIMNRWLEGFAYRIDIGWGTFALAGLLTLIIALGTVSIQSVRAAFANPVESLRYE